MPLILESSKVNKLEFQHEGGSATLFYADPTTKQRVAYSNKIIRRKGNKITNELPATRLAGGKTICTGMGEGDFAIPADNEKGFVLISSDPKSSDYCKDWKDLLYKHQADYLMLLGSHAFEGTSVGGAVEIDEAREDLLGEDLLQENDADPEETLVPPSDELGK